LEKRKTYTVNLPISEIQKILSNLELFGKFHPLITSVEKMNPTKDGHPQYLIKEKPFDSLPIKIQYKAIVKVQPKYIELEIFDIPFTKAFIYYQMQAVNEASTAVDFRLVINSKMPGKVILQRKMINAQDRLMNAINKKT